jgi:hypothetical protein
MELNSTSTIKKIVLSRVRTIHFVRPLLYRAPLYVLMLGLSLAYIGREVFVAQVFLNMPSLADASALARFFIVAVGETTTSIQFTLMVTIAVGIVLARDVVRLATLPLRSYRM